MHRNEIDVQRDATDGPQLPRRALVLLGVSLLIAVALWFGLQFRWRADQRQAGKEAAQLLQEAKRAIEDNRPAAADVALTKLLSISTQYPQRDSIRGEAMCNLAVLIPNRDDAIAFDPIARAEQYFREGSQLLERDSSDALPAAICSASFAELLISLGRHAEALSWAQRASLQAKSRREGKERALLGATLGVVFLKLGKMAEAERFLTAARADYLLINPQHPDLAPVELSMAFADLQAHRYQSVLNHVSQALALKQPGRERTDRLQLEAYGILGNTYSEMHNPSEAEKYYEKWITLQRRWQPDDPNLVTALRNLAIDEKDQNKPLEALEHFAEARQMYEKRNGKNGADYAIATLGMAASYKMADKRNEALQTLMEALELYRALPEERDQVPQILIALGELAYDEGKFCDAFGWYQQAHAMMSRELSGNTPALVELTKSLSDPYYRRHCTWAVGSETPPSL